MFSGQPENLRYLNFVADKFDLRRHMQFNCRVLKMHYNDATSSWSITVSDGRTLTCRFVVMTVGLLSAPTMPRIDGVDDFKGRAFHTFHWPHEHVDLSDKRVGIIGTGATAIQVIGEIADKVGDLTVFQRRPNWVAPLNNREISEEEMASIRARYDEILRLAREHPAASNTSLTVAASTTSRVRSAWRFGTAFTTSLALGSGCRISVRSSWMKKPMRSSPSTSRTVLGSVFTTP